MKTHLILIFAVALFIGCSKSSNPTDSTTTPPANVPSGWSVVPDFAHYIGFYLLPTDFATFGNDLFILTSQGIFYSTDDGVTTTKRDAKIYFIVGGKGMLLVKDNYLFASVPGTPFLLRSSDLGVTWVASGKSIGAYHPFVYNNTLYCASTGSSSAYRSTDNGDTWTVLGTGLSNGYGDVFVEIGGTFYITRYSYKEAFISTDQGATWTFYTGSVCPIIVNTPYSSYKSKVVTADGTTLIARDVLTWPDTVAIWAAASGSTSFAPRMFNRHGISSMVVSGKHIFAAGGGIYHSTDNGKSWENIIPPKPENTSYNLVGISHGILFAAGRALVRRPLSDFK